MIKNRRGYLVHEALESADWVYELSWLFACWLWCNNFWLDQHHTLSLTFKCQSTAVVLVRPLVVAGRILWNKVSFSFPADICLGVVLNWIIRFLWIFPWCQKPMKLYMTARFFGKTFFLPKKVGEQSKNRVFWI